MSTMPDTSTHLLAQLQAFGFNNDEALVYMELLKEPTTHLHLSRVTGVNRTKTYRIAQELERRSLITRRIDDRGTFLVAADPATLEVELVTHEEKLKQQRSLFNTLLPALTAMHTSDSKAFVMRTYEGVGGFKQMLWHELKAQGEVVVFGNGTLESLVESQRWAEQHRSRTAQAGYKTRELLNPGSKKDIFTADENFMRHYQRRHISPDILAFEQQIVMYNNTVAIYHWRQDQKVGVEIVNQAFVRMMRQVFELYWAQAR